ncbi:MAG: HDOD domain-containing protein [Burkholderiaceae bacterium]|nr:HDOD domain-containing protein [Burkholderiaceae bacterium]
MTDPPALANKASPTRKLGRFELRQLLGKSAATMSWLVFDPERALEAVLYMPRVQPADSVATEKWLSDVQLAARLDHPHLARPLEIAVQDHWPYLAVSRSLRQTLAEWMLAHPDAVAGEVARMICQALEALAFAHDAGVAHGDLQLYHLLVDERECVSVAGLDMVAEAEMSGGVRQPMARPGHHSRGRGAPVGADHLRAQRGAAERDVLAIGLLLHHLLTGQPALEQADTAGAIERLPPLGRDIVRLSRSTRYPIAEALRAIANRATDHQPRRRYLNARTLLSALHGWREADAKKSGDPLAILVDRMQAVGHLPTMPDLGILMSRLSLLEQQSNNEIAEQILHDVALSFELLRQVNSAQVQGTQIAGAGTVLTVRRAIALVGIKGVRQAVAALRTWPGPLNESHAEALSQLMVRVRLAGHMAQALRPAGYDAEVMYLLALLQNLGRLMLQYHFPNEAEQIHALMQTLAPTEAGGRELSGMNEEDASYAVLGVSIESIGVAIARQWGLSEEVLHMIRRVAVSRPVRMPDNDADFLRTAASAANEAVDAFLSSRPHKVGAAVANVAQRYARSLDINAKGLRDALQGARAALDTGAAVRPIKGVSSPGLAREEFADTGGQLFEFSESQQASPTRRNA